MPISKQKQPLVCQGWQLGIENNQLERERLVSALASLRPWTSVPPPPPGALLCHNCGFCGDWGQEGEGSSNFEQLQCVWPRSLLDLIRLLSLGWGLGQPSEAVFHLGRQNVPPASAVALFLMKSAGQLLCAVGTMAFLIFAYAGAGTCRSTYSCCPSHQAALQQCFSHCSSLWPCQAPRHQHPESSWHPLESLPAGSLKVAPALSPGPEA